MVGRVGAGEVRIRAKWESAPRNAYVQVLV